jgi:hypothetical protein
MSAANILARKAVRLFGDENKTLLVPPHDGQSGTKDERQGIVLLPAYFEDKLVVYQIADIQ